jgi:hypothetical protein
MIIFTNFLRSLLLTIVFCFIAPMILMGVIFASLFTFAHFPGLRELSHAIANQILLFLSVFGSGVPLRGLIVISLTCSFVGGLFDTYVHYRHIILHLNS